MRLHQATPKPSASSTRLGLHVALGAFLGLGYTLVDAYLDRQLGVAVSTPQNPLGLLHTVIDLVLPTLTGALLAVVAQLSRLRTRMIALEKERSETLEGQIRKIERDQAVWVVAASLLHELKNPLHALGLLLDEALELPESERAEQQVLLQRARAQIEKVSTQLGFLRGLPHAKNPSLPELDLGETLLRTASAHEARAHRQGVTFHVSAEAPKAIASRDYLEVILDNLVENALDSLQEENKGGQIQLSSHVEAGGVRLSVSDNGPGIDSEIENHLFEPLWSTKSRGLGLGLATSRALARAMGSDLVFRREPNRVVFDLLLRGKS
jgi:signal transduction histidine kinase